MGDIELQIFSDRLKTLRTELKLTQVQFVEGLGITSAALSAYEKNLKNPSISVAKRIAEKYHVSIDWLCGLSDNQHITDNYIWTYSDIIKLCRNIENPTYAINKITQKFINEMQKFIEESDHMEKLKQDNLIDQELYDLWIEKELKKYDFPIMLHFTKDEPQIE